MKALTIHNDKSKNTYQRRSSSHLTTDYQNIARLFHSVSGSKIKIQPAGPILFSVSTLSFREEQCLLKILTVTLSWVTAQDWVPPDCQSLNQLGPRQRYPVHLLDFSSFGFQQQPSFQLPSLRALRAARLFGGVSKLQTETNKLIQYLN